VRFVKFDESNFKNKASQAAYRPRKKLLNWRQFDAVNFDRYRFPGLRYRVASALLNPYGFFIRATLRSSSQALPAKELWKITPPTKAI
jgi:hypothetical protein